MILHTLYSLFRGNGLMWSISKISPEIPFTHFLVNLQGSAFQLERVLDLTIAFSFILFPLALLFFIRKRSLGREYLIIILSSTIFSVLNGLTMLSEIYQLWQTYDMIYASLKAMTALASLVAAISIWPLIIRIVKSPTPKELASANLALQEQIEFRNKTNEQTSLQKQNLEQLLNQRSHDLDQTVNQLQTKIDEHKAAQSQVTFQASLLDQVNSAIIATDLDFRVSYWNRHAETTFGWKRHEVIGKPVLEFLSVFKRGRASMEFLEKLKENKSFNGDINVPHKKGHSIPLDIDCSPLLNAQNKQIGFAVVAVDITDHVKYEHQLESEKEQAEQLALAKQNFLATMSHEIRTPLHVIIGMTRLLIDSQPRKDQQEQLKNLQFSANHLLTLINDILDMAKIEAGKVHLEHIDFSVGEVLDGLENSFALKLKEKGLDFSIERDKSIPERLIGDPVRLTQILNNLMSNAIKFTPEGFICLKVKASRKREEIYGLTFEIIDSGIGISNDKLEHIFDNYTQAKANTSRKYGGTGLGLSICKRLVEIQGGEISIRSEEGLGSTFTFNLNYELSSQKVAKTLPKENSYSLDNVRLLLVDDDEANCMVASRFLNKMGVRVEFAHNGEEALQAVQNQDFNIVLMDLQMPIMDGYEATRAIRQLGDAYLKLPIIALSAHVVSDVKDKAKDAGMDDYLSKPFNQDELNKVIAHHLCIATGEPLQPQEEDINSLHQILEAYQDDHQFTEALISSLTRCFQQLDDQLREIVKHHDMVSLRSMIHKLQPTLKLMENHQLKEKLDLLRATLSKDPVDQAEVEQLVSQIGSYSGKSLQVLDEFRGKLNKETKLI